MRINTNIAALNSYNQLKNTQSNLSKSLSRLSSGKRINGAADDAAGLAISEKMKSQTRGLAQAQRNAQDGISMIQTAEGALKESHSILQRMRELSVQSANDTNTSEDRVEIQKEVNQLRDELDRISSTTEFNTKKLLNGDAGSKVNYGTNSSVDSAKTTSDNIKAGSYAVEVTTVAERAQVDGSEAVGDGDVAASETKNVTINGSTISFESVGSDATSTVDNFVEAVNNANIGVIANNNSDTVELRSDGFGASESITVTDDATAQLLNLTSGGGDVSDTGVDVVGTIDSVSASGSGKTLTSTSGDSIGLEVNLTDAAATSVSTHGSVSVTKNDVTTHIGANEDQTMNISINSMSSSDLNVSSLNLESQTGAEDAIGQLDEAIAQVSSERAKLGAYQNRLDHTINNLSTSEENITAAESRISDVDMAKEMMNMSKQQILSQAGTAMMAQANQLPQGVLQLLG